MTNIIVFPQILGILRSTAASRSCSAHMYNIGRIWASTSRAIRLSEDLQDLPEPEAETGFVRTSFGECDVEKLIKVIFSRSWNLTYGALHVVPHPYYKMRVRATGVAVSQSDILSLASFTSTLRSQQLRQEGGFVECQG